jgi:putative two-component system response regulator
VFTKQDIQNAKILAVDDDDVSLDLLAVNLRQRGFVKVMTADGAEKAWDIFQESGAHIVILDLVMPGRDGYWFLEKLRLAEPGLFVPVIVISGSADTSSKIKALSLGARDFVAKPYDMVEVTARIANMIELKYSYDSLQEQKQSLEDLVRKRTNDLHRTFREALNSLSSAIEYHNKETGQHLYRMREFTKILVRGLGMDESRSEALADASVMHDIGKIGIPDSILLKDGPLTPEEWEVMKNHTVIGADILSGYSSKLLKTASQIALYHHEKWNGQGYPRGLSGRDIPLEGRIVALCDTYDALISWRPYKPAWPLEAVVECIASDQGKSFDPELVRIFLDKQQDFAAVAKNMS